jgi:hypothetical protein
MSEQSAFGSIPPLRQGARIVALFLNTGIAWSIYYAASGQLLPGGTGASVWLLSAVAYWLLTLLAAPFFLPPKDALGTAIATILLLVPIDLSTAYMRPELAAVLWTTVALAVVVVVAALVAAFHRDNPTRISRASYRLSGALGKGEVLLTPAVIISAIGFYADHQLPWAITILGFWTFILAAHPVELVLQLAMYLTVQRQTAAALPSVGTIMRVDDPGILRVALGPGQISWKSDVVHIATLANGEKSYVIPLFVQLQSSGLVGTGLCCDISCLSDIEPPSTVPSAVCPLEVPDLAERLGGVLSGESTPRQLVGIVVEGSSIETIRFQATDPSALEQGMVVSARIRDKTIYYQILDAATKEETFQQNPLGIQVVSAAQLGCYDSEHGFQKFPWLPAMNQPVFLAKTENVAAQKLADDEFLVGCVPNTSFGVPVVLGDLVEYHTAILGITGTGKTELSLDIIRNAVSRGTKVFCVDFTGEYKNRLADLQLVPMGLSVKEGSDLEKLLFAVETGTYGAPKEKEALKKFLDAIRPTVAAQVKEFLENSKSRIAVFELSEITNTKATLRTTELYLSAIMEWARENRKAERIMIALEEAHTIVPEVYGSGFDSETQWVVSRIGQIALQGRKYGVGLLLISQRTALVSKTILSQCNTYFTHALVDKTSLDYLSSVYSADHIRAIPNLRFLEFIASGKAVKSERPLLAVRKYDEAKLKASRLLDKKSRPTPVGDGVAPNSTAEVAEEAVADFSTVITEEPPST